MCARDFCWWGFVRSVMVGVPSKSASDFDGWALVVGKASKSAEPDLDGTDSVDFDASGPALELRARVLRTLEPLEAASYNMTMHQEIRSAARVVSPAERVRLFTQLSRRYPQSARVWAELASAVSIRAHLNKTPVPYKQKLRYLRKSTALSPESKRYWIDRALIEGCVGNLRMESWCLRKAIQCGAGVQAYCNLALSGSHNVAGIRRGLLILSAKNCPFSSSRLVVRHRKSLLRQLAMMTAGGRH